MKVQLRLRFNCYGSMLCELPRMKTMTLTSEFWVTFRKNGEGCLLSICQISHQLHKMFLQQCH